ncbi:MAG: ABC transporter permease subunit, partial [Myxococcota bacterium]
MGPLLRIHALASNTFREAIRNKLLYTLLGFSFLMIASGVLLATLSYVEVDEILQDMGMAAIRFFSAGIATFVGIGLIHNEVDRRTIFTILSKPVSRSEFLLGKWAGLTFTVWLQLALMGLAFAIVSALAGAPLHGDHFLAIALIGLELMVLVAIATLFSAFTTPMLAALFTIGLWMIGHLTR